MGFKNTLIEYGSVSKFLHWLIFILLLFMIIYGFCLFYIPKAYQGVAFNIHKMTGLSILVLMLLRLLWTLTNLKPLLPANTPNWQRLAERCVHWLLYIVVICMPIAGWVGTSAANKPPYIGNVLLALPVPQSKELASQAFYIHNNLALIIIALFSIHALAALYHHFIKKDDILQRMLPNSNVP